ncbi:hypothetical protein EON64_04925 [archaeon]|nr:MAG: hypothetical protein EON64_04925 [archaeon]
MTRLRCIIGVVKDLLHLHSPLSTSLASGDRGAGAAGVGAAVLGPNPNREILESLLDKFKRHSSRTKPAGKAVGGGIGVCLCVSALSI